MMYSIKLHPQLPVVQMARLSASHRDPDLKHLRAFGLKT